MAGTIAQTVDLRLSDDGDLIPSMPTVTGHRCIVQRLMMAWTTPRGRVPWWPHRGTDLRQFLLSKADPADIIFAAESEAKLDEQVQNIVVTIDAEAFSIDQRTLPISATVFTDDEEVFAFTMTISEARAQLLTLVSQNS